MENISWFFKIVFSSVEVNISNLTEEEKINNIACIKQLKMTEEKKN